MKRSKIILLCLAPVLAALLSLFVGRYRISIDEVWSVLWGGSQQTVSIAVVLQLRLPRIIAAAFVGAGLAASGAALQGVFQNPLVSAGLLGVSAGAGFGAALAIVLFPVFWMTYPFAFFFGLLAVLLSYWIARIYKTVPTIMLVLGGTIVSALFSLIHDASSKPVITGIFMSVMTISKASFSSASTACFPFMQHFATEKSGAALSRTDLTILAIGGSSSTIITLYIFSSCVLLTYILYFSPAVMCITAPFSLYILNLILLS